MPDCQELNCTSNCLEEPTPDGCYECVCSDPVANVCPPIPPCPSRCQIKLGSGCPSCSCPEEVTEPPCPRVSCPNSCTEITGPDGCPACDCPPPDVVCPQMPACALGCIDRSDEAGYEACLTCNCTIIEDLLEENQIIPTDAAGENPNLAPEVEPFLDTIDPGLVAGPEVRRPEPPASTNPNTLNSSDPRVMSNGMPNNGNPQIETTGLPNNVNPQVETVGPPNNGNPEMGSVGLPPNIGNPQAETVGLPLPLGEGAPRNPTNSNIPPPPDYVDTFQPDSSGSPSRNPASNPSFSQLPNERQRINPAIPQNGPRQPPFDIQCGETSCPPGCSLCIQSDNCGRCLCGEHARICPAVPSCPPQCIGPGQLGCFTCSCPLPSPSQFPGGLVSSLPGLLPSIPTIVREEIDFSSAENFFPASNGRLPPHVTLVRVPSSGPPMRHILDPFSGQDHLGNRVNGPNIRNIQNSPNLNQSPFSHLDPNNRPSRRPQEPFTPSNGFIALRNIPSDLLGISRFHTRRENL